MKALSEGLAALSRRAPQVAESYTYTQTVPSSLHATTHVRANVRVVNLVEVRVPAAMAVLGLLSLGFGIFLLRRSRRGHSGTNGPTQPVTIPSEPGADQLPPTRTYEGV